jgi:glutathione peroxidase
MNFKWASSLVLAVVALTACNRAPPPPTAEVAQERSAAVAAAVQEQQARFAAAPAVAQADPATAYQFEFSGLWSDRVPMTAFEGEVVLVVNTASRCGYTPQYEGLQEIYTEYHGQGFEVVGVPSNNFAGQEPGTAQEIQDFCSLNYGVTFPMAGKTEVVGAEAHPFYKWAEAQLGQSAVPGWNFHKILLGRDGRLIAAFPSDVEPASQELRAAITQALAAGGNTATPTALH